MLRIALIPGVLFLLWEGTPKSNFWATILYIGTALTDLIDGYLARKWGQISVLGKFLDPLADKLLVMATLIFLAYLGRLPFLGVVAVIIMLGRELAVTALRTIAMSEGVVMAAMRTESSAARRISSLRQSSPYQRSEKPPQTVTSRESLNE